MPNPSKQHGGSIEKKGDVVEWIEARVTFDSDKQPLAAELIADIFHDLGVKGVSLQEPGHEATPDWAEDAPPTPDHYAVTGYFPNDGRLQGRCRFLEDRLFLLQSQGGIVFRISYTKIDEKDWAESWKIHFWPQKVSPRIVIKPTWRKYAPNPEEIVIEIDPEQKQAIYEALSSEGLTLKDWFLGQANDFLRNRHQLRIDFLGASEDAGDGVKS